MDYVDDLNREIIIDHVQNPRNKKINDNYLQKQVKNPTCGDIITIFMDIKKKRIKDVTYQVEGCSLCIASASIMSELLKEKKLSEANQIIDQISKMLRGEKFKRKILGEAICFEGIKDVMPRIKCVTLAYKGFKEACGEVDDRL